MSQINLINNKENINLSGIKDDVDHPHENSVSTDLPSVDEIKSENNGVLVLETKDSCASGIVVNCGVLNKNNLKTFNNYKFTNGSYCKNSCSNRNNNNNNNNNNKDSSSGDGETKEYDKTDGSGGRNNLKIKRKRRRRKSKRSSNNVTYGGRAAWKYNHGARAQENRRRLKMLTLVPYNTNKFLMEDHMPEKSPPPQRTRDSSFSVDSEENYFFSLPNDDEDFLTKEFSSVYEDARVERLEGLSKQQLIQEFLQLQASFDQLTRRYMAAKERDAPADPLLKIRALEEKVTQLQAENVDLRRKSESSSSKNQDYQMGSSEDSESDSSTSSSSSSSSSSSCSSISDCEEDFAMALNDCGGDKLIENGDLMDYRTPCDSPVNDSPQPSSILPLLPAPSPPSNQQIII